jgi:hypothetical protein
MAHAPASTSQEAGTDPPRRVRPAAGSAGASPAAPLAGIRQYEQVQTRDKLQRQRDHRQEAHRGGVLLLCNGNDVHDHGYRKGHGQPPLDMPKPFVPVQWDLL